MALTCKMKTGGGASINTSQLGAASILDLASDWGSLQLIRVDGHPLTEVVVVFWLPRVADLLDVDVGGSGWNSHHSVVTWRRRKKSGKTEQTTGESEPEEAGKPSAMTAVERSRLHTANSFTMLAT